LEDARKVLVSDILKLPGDRVFYEYDFGDGWLHDIVLEKVIALNKSVYRCPRCLAGDE